MSKKYCFKDYIVDYPVMLFPLVIALAGIGTAFIYFIAWLI